MTLGTDVSWALPELRRQAESLMTDTGTMYRPTGRTAQSPTTGRETPIFDTLFSSKCKVQARDLAAQVEEAGGRTAVTVRTELHLPVTAAAVQVGDEWQMDTSNDAQLVGRRFRVTAPVAKTFATARRLEVEEVVS